MANRVSVFESSGDTLFDHTKAFSAFVASTDQKENTARHIGQIVTKVFGGGELAASFGERPVIVDVGVGEGTLAHQYLRKLGPTYPGHNFIGIDPSPGMIEGCRKTLYGNHSIKPGDQLICEPFFDHPSGGMPQALKGVKANLAIGSHVMYYAHDIPKAVRQFEELCGDKGISLIVNQAGTSEMHRLRNAYSNTPQTLRQADGQPNSAEHVAAAVSPVAQMIPRVSYSSRLFLPNDYGRHLAFLTTMLSTGVPRGEWSTRARKGFGEEGAKECSRTAGVLEFILRDRLDADPARSRTFIGTVWRMAGQKLAAGSIRPFIGIDEAVVFSAAPKLVPALAAAVTIYNRDRAAEELRKGNDTPGQPLTHPENS